MGELVVAACDILTWVCLVAGGFFSVVGAIGIVRLPDFFARMHGGGITDTMGAGLILVGLMFQAGLSLALLKVLMILAFLLITSPTGCHALAQAAWTQGLRPTPSADAARSQPAPEQRGVLRR
jgi:multicomponent Na+:H+ antiporter subunit G